MDGGRFYVSFQVVDCTLAFRAVLLVSICRAIFTVNVRGDTSSISRSIFQLFYMDEVIACSFGPTVGYMRFCLYLLLFDFKSRYVFCDFLLINDPLRIFVRVGCFLNQGHATAYG